MNCQARWTVTQKRFPRTAAGEWKDHALLEATVRLHFRTRKQARRDNRAYMATDEGRAALSPAFRNRMSEYDAELVKKAAARDERARLDRAGLMERLAEGTAREGIIEGTSETLGSLFNMPAGASAARACQCTGDDSMVAAVAPAALACRYIGDGSMIADDHSVIVVVDPDTSPSSSSSGHACNKSCAG